MIRYSSLRVLAAACGGDGPCIVVPGCPVGLAVRLSITATTTHAPVNNIEARGFQSTQRTVTVTSSSRISDVFGPNGFEGKSCSCEIVNQQSVDVALVPAS